MMIPPGDRRDATAFGFLSCFPTTWRGGLVAAPSFFRA